MAGEENKVDEISQIELLKSSRILSNFVAQQKGNWNHSDWENLLKKLKEQNFALSNDKIGLLLDEEKRKYLEKRLDDVKKEPEKVVLEETHSFEKLGKKERRRYMKLWIIDKMEGKGGV